MKRLRIILIVLVLMSLGTTTSAKENHKQHFASLTLQRGEATAEGVTEYLQSTGHVVLTCPVSFDGGYTWHCLTKIGLRVYVSHVFTDGVSIVGYEDEQLG